MWDINYECASLNLRIALRPIPILFSPFQDIMIFFKTIKHLKLGPHWGSGLDLYNKFDSYLICCPKGLDNLNSSFPNLYTYITTVLFCPMWDFILQYPRQVQLEAHLWLAQFDFGFLFLGLYSFFLFGCLGLCHYFFLVKGLSFFFILFLF